jgi:hypothetical protein
MRLRFVALAVLTVSALTPLFAQQTIAPDQQMAALFRTIAQHSDRLLPLLEQVHAKDWVAKGAPGTYATQLASAQQQIQAIDSDMETLAQHPERMQDSMKALFRVQSFHRSLDSLMGGLRKYQNPALADLILSVALEDQEDVGKLQEHILELATQREQEYLVVDHEAQRCRGVISREAAPQRKK